MQGLSDATAQERAREYYLQGGHSENQTGLAVDLATATVPAKSQAFAESSEYRWLLENAHKYGFILRYAEGTQDITGMPFMPYHFRYVGIDNATAILAANVTLEEYVGKAPAQQTPESASSDSSSAT